MHPDQFPGLAGDHDHSGTGQITQQHRLGQQLRDHGQPQGGSDQPDGTRQHRQTGGQRQGPLGVAAGMGVHHRECDHGCGRGRPDGDRTGRGEQGKGHRGPHHGVQAGGRRQTGLLAISQRLRDQSGPGRQPSQGVTAQLRQPVGAQLPQNREKGGWRFRRVGVGRAHRILARADGSSRVWVATCSLCGWGGASQVERRRGRKAEAGNQAAPCSGSGAGSCRCWALSGQAAEWSRRQEADMRPPSRSSPQ
jgi:hypothetical protein